MYVVPTSMIPERIAQIEATLQNNAQIPEVTRRELLDLLAGLKAEVGPLIETHGQSAQHIVGSAEVATQTAVRRGEEPAQADEALEGLTDSVREFEASHPQLVQVVGRLAHTLSNMGI
jgi:hypothetical protein